LMTYNTTYGSYPDSYYWAIPSLNSDWEDDDFEFSLKMVDHDNDYNWRLSGDDDCVWYYGIPDGETGDRWYGGEDTSDDLGEPVGGRCVPVTDDDTVAPLIPHDQYGILMVNWTGINDGIGMVPTYGMYVNVTVVEENGVSAMNGETYLEIFGADGKWHRFNITDAQNQIIKGELWDAQRYEYTVMFKVSGFTPGNHSYRIRLTDNDTAGSKAFKFYSTTELDDLDRDIPGGGPASDTQYPMTFIDDDDGAPVVIGRHVPEIVIDYDQNLIVVFNITDPSSPDPDLVVTKYSLNYGGWIEIPKAQLGHGSPYILYNGSDIIGYNYTFTIDESYIFYSDGVLYLQLTVFASDKDTDSVADKIDAEYHLIDVSQDWYTVHLGLMIRDSVPPDFVPDSFTGPVDDVLYNDDNIVQVTAYEEWDASLVSHGVLNYTTDNWATWATTEMVPVETQSLSYIVEATLAGRIPLIYNSPVIKYRVTVFDNAGNSAIYEGELQVDSVGDETLPQLMYSRVLGAEPSVNGTVAVRFYEPYGASGVKDVNVTVKVGVGENEYKMFYHAATDSWLYHLPQFDESTTIQYKFKAWDNARPTTYQITEWFSYYVQEFTALFNVRGDILNNLSDENTVVHMRTFFSVGTQGAYGFVPIYTGHVANFTMWLDGMYIPNGAQMILDTNVHTLMVRVDAAERDALWGVKLVNMRGDETVSDGILKFNVLAPAPPNDELRVDNAWATGLLTLTEYHTNYEYHDADYIDGSFETGWLTGWSKRKSHIIEGSQGAGRFYQIQVDVSNYGGSDTGNNVHTPGCKSDFGDIRFTSDDGVTKLDYWLEYVDDEGGGQYTATFWVEVMDSLDYNQTIYIYYGNSGASSISDGDATFLFFDAFDGSVIDTDKWNVTLGQEGDDFDVANGYIEFLDAADERANIISYDADSWTGGVALEFNWYWESTWNIIAAGLCEPDPTYGYWSGSDDAAIYETRVTDTWDVENDGGNDHIQTYTSTNGVWSTQGVYWYSTSHLEIYDERVEKYDWTTGLPDEDLHVIFSS
ncbi:MAG: DUF2341 domain-containing protein, partial [Candidatus Thorarchaeota archaeon]